MSNQTYIVGRLKSKSRKKYDVIWDEIDKDVWLHPDHIELGKASTAYEALDKAKEYLRDK